MIDTLITSKTRVKILLKFFLNSKNASYLRSLSSEFNESTNAIRGELNRLEQAGLLESFSQGNKKMYRANTHHPLFNDIHNILLKHTGFDQIIDRILFKIGPLQYCWVVGEFAKGNDSAIVDLVLVGKGIDKNYLNRLVVKTEKIIDRKIRYIVLSVEEFPQYLESFPEALLLYRGE
ncbi:MAG: transcriptional regulator [Bacteroidetes bacterium]|nr:MAG: transcriptional regulator [Bacteroidota bacterium]PIE87916.1 MAG: transcriptional regulator [Bacteroidota bacterium]